MICMQQVTCTKSNNVENHTSASQEQVSQDSFCGQSGTNFENPKTQDSTFGEKCHKVEILWFWGIKLGADFGPNVSLWAIMSCNSIRLVLIPQSLPEWMHKEGGTTFLYGNMFMQDSLPNTLIFSFLSQIASQLSVFFIHLLMCATSTMISLYFLSSLPNLLSILCLFVTNIFPILCFFPTPSLCVPLLQGCLWFSLM